MTKSAPATDPVHGSEEINRVIVRNSAVSPLGGLRLAGLFESGIGVSEVSRVFSRYSIAYVFSGHGYYRGQTTGEYEIKDGSAILVRPGEHHWYGPNVGSTWSEVFFEFEGPVFDLWFSKSNFDWSSPVMRLEPIGYWKERMLSTIGQGNHGNPNKMVAECLRIQLLLSEILDASRVSFKEEIEWLESAKSALVNQPDGKSAARALGLSYESFRKRFKKLVGLSPGRFRTSLIMDEACARMEDKTRTIKSISEELGFCDEYHFSRQFKKTVGWTPSNYRARFCGEHSGQTFDLTDPFKIHVSAQTQPDAVTSDREV